MSPLGNEARSRIHSCALIATPSGANLQNICGSRERPRREAEDWEAVDVGAIDRLGIYASQPMRNQPIVRCRIIDLNRSTILLVTDPFDVLKWASIVPEQLTYH